MKNKIYFAIAAALAMALCIGALTACGEFEINTENDFFGEGEVVAKSETLAAGSDYKLVVKDLLVSDGTINIAYTEEEEPSVAVSTNTNISEKLKLEVSEGVISIEGDSDLYFKPTEFTINISGKLKDLDIGDAFKLNIEQPDMDEFKLFIRGASKGTIKLGKTDKFELKTNGGANVTIEGECDKAVMDINGVGIIDAYGLIAKEAEVSVNGAAKLYVYASEKLTASVNGIGNIIYDGNPPVVVPQINGLGKIKSKGE